MTNPTAPPRLFTPPALPERLASIVHQWQQGAEPDARAVLEQHPEWLADKPFVQDLVLEEFCQRAERGEAVDVETFASRFPLYRTSIKRMLAAQQILDENDAALEKAAPVRWPGPGEQVGDLTLVRELGRGAFARVFLATEATAGDRNVVVKLSYEGRHEAHTLGPLEHPNIVRVLSAGIDERTGLSVVRMPYHGQATLEDLLDRAHRGTARDILAVARDDAVTTQEAVATELEKGSYEDGVAWLVGQLAGALAFLHQRGICHRDLKPSNVLLSPTGQPLLLDFNLSADGRLPTRRLGGTLAYMAPEQVRAMTGSDHAMPEAPADVFALGVIAYEQLTGRHPYAPVPVTAPVQELAELLLLRQHQGPAPLREHNPRVPRSLARLLERCLAPAPADRPTAAELERAIRRYFSPSQRRRRWLLRHPLLVAAGTAAVLALAGGAVKLTRDVLQTAPSPRAEADRLYERGRELMAQNELETAGDCFRESNRLLSDGRALACLAYLEARNRDHYKAVAVADEAVKRGLKSARLLNNRGYSRLKLCETFRARRDATQAASTFDAAAADFTEALRLDPTLQAAHYNRGNLALRRALSEPAWEVPEQALKDMRQAIHLGPVTQELLYDTARLFALACRARPELRTEMVQHLARAIELGHDPQGLEQDPPFLHCKADPGFRELLTAKRGNPQPHQELQLLDPLPANESIARQ